MRTYRGKYLHNIRVLIVLLTAKAYFKALLFVRCFELLQQQFMLTPTFTVLLFVFGKYVVKAMH